MWEHWNGIKEDGTFWSDKMNSFNHYAYGAVYAWIFDTVMGISPVEPAYKSISIAPHPSKELGFATASLQTRFGTVRSAWYYRGDTVHYEFDVPAGVSARICLPNGKVTNVCGGSHLFAQKI